MKKSSQQKSLFRSLPFSELLTVGLVLGVAALVYWQRLWYLRFFTYDQARDALFIKRILDGKLRLIGTQSSIPGLYTAPLYYYLLAPFLALFNRNPVGVDFAIGLFALVTAALVYHEVRQSGSGWLGALVLMTLYAFCAPVVDQARFGWNPNLLPLTTMLFVYGARLVFVSHQARGWLWIWLAIGAAINFHYSGLGLLMGLAVVWLIYRPAGWWREKFFWLGLVIFLSLLLPLFVFDFRHQGVNLQAVVHYLQHGTGGTLPAPPFWSGLWSKHLVMMELVFPFPNLWLKLISVCWLILVGLQLRKSKTFRGRSFIAGLVGLYLAGLVFAGLYKGSFFPFYLTFLYPLPFLITGFLLIEGKKTQRYFWWGAVVLGLVLGVTCPTLSLTDSEFKGRFGQLDLVAFSFTSRIDPLEKFNLAANYTAGDRFDHNAVDYRYFLEALYGIPVPGWDVLDYQEAEVLYLISETGPLNPLSVDSWEVLTFGPKKAIGYWTVGETYVYKLAK